MGRNTSPSSGRPAPGARLQVAVTGIGAQAMGVAHVDGFALLIPRALPGERVEVEVGAVHPRYAQARVVEVLEPVPFRVEPPCPDFGACGGCDWLHVDYPQQLEFKRQVVEDQLRRIGKAEPPAGWEIVPCEAPLGYRDKLEFAVARGGGGGRPGFHGIADGRPVAVEACLLAPPAYTQLARAALDVLSQGMQAIPEAAAALTRITVQGTLTPQGGAGLALTLHCNEPAAAALLQEHAGPFLAALEQEYPHLREVAVVLRPRGARRDRGRWLHLKGRGGLTKAVGEARYGVPQAGFFQVNLPQAARLVEAVAGIAAEALAPSPGTASPEGEAPFALDLFCGVGLHALRLAEAGARVVGVEAHQEAVRAAAATARQRGLERAQFRAADLARPGILQGLVSKHGPPACIVTNPPRSGLPGPLSEALLGTAAPLLIYVSCDGGTFARDVARLAPRYALAGLRGFDMFPQTHHLELVATFRPRPE